MFMNKEERYITRAIADKLHMEIQILLWGLIDYQQEEGEKHVIAKRVNIVSVKMVKASSVLYKNRVVRSPEDASELFRQFLGDDSYVSLKEKGYI